MTDKPKRAKMAHCINRDITVLVDAGTEKWVTKYVEGGNPMGWLEGKMVDENKGIGEPGNFVVCDIKAYIALPADKRPAFKDREFKVMEYDQDSWDNKYTWKVRVPTFDKDQYIDLSYTMNSGLEEAVAGRGKGSLVHVSRPDKAYEFELVGSVKPSEVVGGSEKFADDVALEDIPF